MFHLLIFQVVAIFLQTNIVEKQVTVDDLMTGKVSVVGSFDQPLGEWNSCEFSNTNGMITIWRGSSAVVSENVYYFKENGSLQKSDSLEDTPGRRAWFCERLTFTGTPGGFYQPGDLAGASKGYVVKSELILSFEEVVNVHPLKTSADSMKLSASEIVNQKVKIIGSLDVPIGSVRKGKLVVTENVGRVNIQFQLSSQSLSHPYPFADVRFDCPSRKVLTVEEISRYMKQQYNEKDQEKAFLGYAKSTDLSEVFLFEDCTMRLNKDDKLLSIHKELVVRLPPD